MKERLKQLRKVLGLNQKEFAEPLNVSHAAVSSYEKGIRSLTDRTISDICRVYNVNETWLRTGIGEMFDISDDALRSNINERIRALRESMSISQEEFGKRLGVSRSVIKNIDYKKTVPKDLFIDLLCKTFSVNKEWLISGTGGMFISSADNILNQLSREYKLDPTDEAIIKTYLSFGGDERKIIKRYITETAERIAGSDECDNQP